MGSFVLAIICSILVYQTMDDGRWTISHRLSSVVYRRKLVRISESLHSGPSILALALLIALTGCAAPETAPAPTPPATTSAPTTAPSPGSPPTATGDTARRPFPQHVTYASGSIKPTQHNQAELDAVVQAAYRAWKQAYLKSGCGAGRFYVDPGPGAGGPASRAVSVSEGHGYGMIIAVFMAGADPEAKQIFDGMYAFFKDHPSAGSPHLMAWKQVEGCKNVDLRSTGSATDGDMDIAYALLLADRQWAGRGPIDYRRAAIEVINALKAKTVNPRTYTLLLGDWVSAGDTQRYYATRSSDFMPEHLRAYAAATGDAAWTRVAGTTYDLIAALQRVYSPATGLLPDFIQDVNAKPRPASPRFLENDTDGQYAYNACRAPLRIATDYLLAGDPRALEALRPINAWLRAATGGDPRKIVGGYKLDGAAAVSYYEPAFAAPFGVGAMAGAENQEWLNAIWDQLAAESSTGYYSDSLRMLALLVMSGNWWSPRN